MRIWWSHKVILLDLVIDLQINRLLLLKLSCLERRLIFGLLFPRLLRLLLKAVKYFDWLVYESLGLRYVRQVERSLAFGLLAFFLNREAVEAMV